MEEPNVATVSKKVELVAPQTQEKWTIEKPKNAIGSWLVDGKGERIAYSQFDVNQGKTRDAHNASIDRILAKLYAVECLEEGLRKLKDLGQAYRNDWSGFDGRVLRDEIDAIVDPLLAQLAEKSTPPSATTKDKSLEDTKRLDWLAKQSPEVDVVSHDDLTGAEIHSWTLCFNYPQISDDGSEGIREAIDAAMAREERRTSKPQSPWATYPCDNRQETAR